MCRADSDKIPSVPVVATSSAPWTAWPRLSNAPFLASGREGEAAKMLLDAIPKTLTP